ncbi:hypothetical protein HDV05_006951 [Chytridiales sp. JEL 0842]|nr:hypothetical protein HDV05_006951 [Chytridiales sp. JEL 0842]
MTKEADEVPRLAEHATLKAAVQPEDLRRLDSALSTAAGLNLHNTNSGKRKRDGDEEAGVVDHHEPPGSLRTAETEPEFGLDRNQSEPITTPIEDDSTKFEQDRTAIGEVDRSQSPSGPDFEAASTTSQLLPQPSHPSLVKVDQTSSDSGLATPGNLTEGLSSHAQSPDSATGPALDESDCNRQQSTQSLTTIQSSSTPAPHTNSDNSHIDTTKSKSRKRSRKDLNGAAMNDPNHPRTAVPNFSAVPASSPQIIFAPSPTPMLPPTPPVTVPVIRLPKSVYTSVLSSSVPSSVAASQPYVWPPETQYSQWILVGTRDTFNHKLMMEIETAVPFSSTPNHLASMIASNINKEGRTVLGWAVSTRHGDPYTPTPASLEAAAEKVSTAYFDVFQSAFLNVMATNCHTLKSNPTRENVTRFCQEACGMMLDSIGLVCLSRNIFAGGATMVSFDTPFLTPADVERRLLTIMPDLRDLLSKTSSTTATTIPSFPPNVAPFDTHPQQQPPFVIPPSKHPATLINVIPPSKPVRQLPHSSLHILPGPLSDFASKIISPEFLLKPSLSSSPSTQTTRQRDRGFAFPDDDAPPPSSTTPSSTALPPRLDSIATKIRDMVNVSLGSQVDAYAQKLAELKELMYLAKILNGISEAEIDKEVSETLREQAQSLPKQQ